MFVYEFPNVDVTESGVAEVIARDRSGKEIARHSVSSFAGKGKIVARAVTGPVGWLADGADIAMVDFRLVDANGTVHPYASGTNTWRASAARYTSIPSKSCAVRSNATRKPRKEYSRIKR